VLPLLAAIAAAFAPHAATFAFTENPAGVFINEIHYDDTGNPDAGEAVEIAGPAGTDLGGWSLVLYNGATGATYDTIALSGSIPGQQSGMGTLQFATPGIQNGAPDGLALVRGATVVQFLSYEGSFVAAGGPANGLTSTDIGVSETNSTATGSSLQLAGTGASYQSFGWAAAGPATFGGPNTGQTFTTPPDAAPSVLATSPANGALGIQPDGALSVTFSEPVVASASSLTLSCNSAPVAVTGVSAAGNTVTFAHDALPLSSACTATVVAAQVSDQDANDPPDSMAADYVYTFGTASSCAGAFTPIPHIQGAGAAAAVSGAVTTQGVVVGDYEGPSPRLRGFYIQDAAGDGDQATSDAIFVFNGDNDSVAAGQLVRVAGTVAEFQDQTQIGTLTSIEICAGAAPAVSPAEVTLPVPAALSGVPYLERYEGMLVRLPQTLYVTEHFQLGRFGQVELSAGGRLRVPTSVAEPGAAAQALAELNSRSEIVLDDDLNSQNPDPIVYGRGGNPLSAANTLRGGDTASGIIGVMTYTWAGNSASGNAYRVRPTEPVVFQASNPRPAAPPDVGGRLRVASANLLNYFNTFGVGACATGVGGASTDCRGADSQAEFDRQWPKTVAAITASGADIVGVMELENDGYGPASAIQDLTDKLNGATAPGTYAFIDVDAATGQVNALGSDAIRVAILYKPAKVTPVGTTAALNTGAFGQINLSGGGSIQRNRPALAQTFEENGTGLRITVVANHLKSKGSACSDNAGPVGPDPDAGDGQGNCNLTRTQAAQELAAWLAGDPTGAGVANTLIIGDMNSYAQEDPIQALEDAGYINEVAARIGPEAYSYVFDGEWGYLDHALASARLHSQITGVAEWHINADEPSVLDYNTDFKTLAQQAALYSPDQFRVSDHDPVIIGLALDAQPYRLNLPIIVR
jgi:predicted extracellular nuclease